MVPEGRYRNPPTQTPASIAARPGKWYLVIWIEGGVSLGLAGSSRARMLIVTIPGHFLSPGGSVQSPGEKPRWSRYWSMGLCHVMGVCGMKLSLSLILE